MKWNKEGLSDSYERVPLFLSLKEIGILAVFIQIFFAVFTHIW